MGRFTPVAWELTSASASLAQQFGSTRVRVATEAVQIT
jgi:hypothetical protein